MAHQAGRPRNPWVRPGSAEVTGNEGGIPGTVTWIQEPEDRETEMTFEAGYTANLALRHRRVGTFLIFGRTDRRRKPAGPRAKMEA